MNLELRLLGIKISDLCSWSRSEHIVCDVVVITGFDDMVDEEM